MYLYFFTIQPLCFAEDDIRIGKNDANSFLRTPRDGTSGTIVCECCLNRCASSELNQYCQLQRRRRRSVRTEIITMADVERIYAEINNTINASTEVVMNPLLTRFMLRLEQIKWENIVKAQNLHSTHRIRHMQSKISSSHRVGIAP